MPGTPSSILISRTDAIGDVVLTLPMASVLKEHFPEATIGFLARGYTQPVVEACPAVDVIVDADAGLSEGVAAERWDTIVHVFPEPRIAQWASKVGIPLRIGTTNRLYHWWTCNRLVPLSRKHSDIHEAQLNLKLLKPLGIDKYLGLDELRKLRLLKPVAIIPETIQPLLQTEQKKIILHPTSMGSAREWGLENFRELAVRLVQAGYSVFITGTQKDQPVLQPLLGELGDSVHDLSGRLTLPELISFIALCDGLVAGSTGPLHLAAALGIVAVGLYPAERPMHPGRWAPIGPHASYLTAKELASSVTAGLPGITVESVFQHLHAALHNYHHSHSRIV